MDDDNSLNQPKTTAIPALIDVVRAIAENGRKTTGESINDPFLTWPKRLII